MQNCVGACAHTHEFIVEVLVGMHAGMVLVLPFVHEQFCLSYVYFHPSIPHFSNDKVCPKLCLGGGGVPVGWPYGPAHEDLR